MSTDNLNAEPDSILAKAIASGMVWHEQSDSESLAGDLSEAICDRLIAAINEYGRASLVVSGGSTPAPVFAKLAVAPLDWSKVTVTLADERWVAPGHSDSNESLVRNTLLVNKASAAAFVSLYRDNCTPEQALGPVSEDLAAMLMPFTVVVLGMGGDGHTASLFPDAPADELADAMSLENNASVAIMHPPSVNQARITLTRRCLLDAQHLFVHITGAEKKSVLIQAMAEAASTSLDGASFAAYTKGQAPIVGLVTDNMASVSVYWSK